MQKQGEAKLMGEAPRLGLRRHTPSPLGLQTKAADGQRAERCIPRCSSHFKNGNGWEDSQTTSVDSWMNRSMERRAIMVVRRAAIAAIGREGARIGH